jgi:hypothetical protein
VFLSLFSNTSCLRHTNETGAHCLRLYKYLTCDLRIIYSLIDFSLLANQTSKR